MARPSRAPSPVQASAISPRGRTRDARLLEQYVRREQQSALPFLEHVLSVGNAPMREVATSQMARLDAARTEQCLVSLVTALDGQTTRKAIQERRLLVSLLPRLNTVSALRAFLAAGGAGIDHLFVGRDAVLQVLLEEIPRLDAAGVKSLLERTSTALDHVWLHGEEMRLAFARLLFAHPSLEVQELAAGVMVSHHHSERTEELHRTSNEIAQQMLESPSEVLRSAARKALWDDNARVRGGALQHQVSAMARELLAHADSEMQALGARLLVRHEGLTGLEALTVQGRTPPVADVWPSFCDRWDESLAALGRYMEDLPSRSFLARSIRHQKPGSPLGDDWIARLAPFAEEDDVRACLAVHLHPASIERTRALAASEEFTPRTLEACQLLGELGDTAASPLVLRWVQDVNRPEAAALREALSGCGDASAIAALEALRQRWRALDTDLYIVIRNIRRRLERW